MSKIVNKLDSSGYTVIGYRCDGCENEYINLFDLHEPDHYDWVASDDLHYCPDCVNRLQCIIKCSKCGITKPADDFDTDSHEDICVDCYVKENSRDYVW